MLELVIEKNSHISAKFATTLLHKINVCYRELNYRRRECEANEAKHGV